MSATPTPWEQGSTFKSAIFAQDKLVANTTRHAHGANKAAANAALIVKAVNAYQPMLEALEKVADFIRPFDADRLHHELECVIALAKGETA